MTSPIGKPVNRVDGRAKVTGAAKYAADHKLDRRAYGYLVTSTVGRGTIESINADAATSAPGVVAVYSPFNSLKLFTYTQNQNDEQIPPLQDTTVRYYGQTIAMVVAETYEQARDAAGLIKVGYAAQPPRASFLDGVPNALPTSSPVVEVLAPGVASIDDALAASEVTVSATYTTPVENHVAMEPHATTAVWNGDHLTLYTVTQGVRLVVSRMANTLGIDAAKIHVINPHVGGGFGNKWGNWAQAPLTAAAARALQRPVTTVLTREQTFTVVGHRPESHQTVSLGATRDGTLTALKHVGISSKAESAWFSEPVANISTVMYSTPNLRIERKIVPLDVPPTTIMRAPSETSGSFALECAIDELAGKLGVDPLQVRRKSYSTVVPTSKAVYSSKHLDECFDVGAEMIDWSRRNRTPGAVTDGDWLVGMGMAAATFSAGRGASTMKVWLHADGTATVGGTGADLGTGQTTVFSIVGADRLGIPVERVKAEIGDSSLPPAVNAGGSGSTSANGPAAQVAADAAKKALIDVAVQTPGSPFFGMSPTAVVWEAGHLKAENLSVAFGELLTDLDIPAVEATATSPSGSRPGIAFRSWGAHFCEVRINRWTREPRISRMVSVIDAGQIVNAAAARSQIIGCMIMGIGQAVLEEGRFEPGNGRYANGNMQSYLVPVNADTPRLDVHLLDHPDTTLSELGARGLGELGLVGVGAAIGNAVYNATGRRVRSLPITLDKLL